MSSPTASNTSQIVIIGIDGSDEAEHAFDFFRKYLYKPSHRLLLVHTAEPPQIPSQQAMFIDGAMWDSLVAKAKAHVKTLEEKFATKMRENHMSGKIKAIFSMKAGEVIVQCAKEEHADMIVVGTRGLGTVRRTILGSVSDYVLHHAHCPVIICHGS